MTHPYATGGGPGRPAPKWARKRFALPALGAAFLLGGAALGGGDGGRDDAKPLSARPAPSATVTATATVTVTPEPEPAPTVTETVKVKVTRTVTAQPAGGSGGGSGGGGSVYYPNCAAARAAGAAPVRAGEPGYGRHLDRDGDGVGCDWG